MRKLEVAELQRMGLSDKAANVYSTSSFKVSYNVVTRDAEAGNVIDSFKAVSESERAIEEYEEEDRENGTYIECFYEVAEAFNIDGNEYRTIEDVNEFFEELA